MTDRRRPEWVVNHPMVDQPVPLAAGLLVALTAWRSAMPAAELTTVVTGVTTIAALVMAAATFICTMTYQSANILMTHVRDRYAAELRRNWGSVIGGAFAAAALPVAVLFAVGSQRWTLGATAYSLILVAFKMARAAFWLRYTLFMQSASGLRSQAPLSSLLDAQPSKAPVVPRAR